MDRLLAVRVFVTVAERGSLTAAADQLDMSRAMVTRYLAAMETWMGSRLLHRTTRRISLTDIGQQVLLQSRHMLELGDSMENLAIRPDSTPRGRLRLSSSHSFAIDFLMAAVDDYLHQNSEAQVEIVVSDRAVNLVEERIDLAIRITNDLDPNLVARRLGQCRSVVCASPDYLHHHGRPQTPSDLSHHNCFTHSYFGDQHWQLSKHDDTVSVPVQGNLSSNDSTLLLQNTLRGSGIALLPLYSVHQLIQQGRLEPLLSDYQPIVLGIHGLYSNRRHMSPLLRSFIDFMVARMHSDAGQGLF